jgi:hypothetical protein
MIQPNELRIGNWIHLKAYPLSGDVNENAKVIELAENYIRTEISISYQLPSSEIYGITITPEILDRIGFERRAVNIFYKKGLIDSFIYHYDGFFVWEANANIYKYVHQLQNLYFALTGVELPIDL